MYGLVNEQFDDLPAPVIGMMLGGGAVGGQLRRLDASARRTGGDYREPEEVAAVDHGHLVYGASMGLAYDALDNVL
jgi:hypothetical protein